MDAVSSPGCTVGLPNGKMAVIVESFVAEIKPRAGQTAVRTLAEARHFFFPNNLQTGSGTHHTFYSKSPGVLPQRKNGRGREIDHSPPSRAEVKKGKAIPLLIPYVRKTWKGQFYGGIGRRKGEWCGLPGQQSRRGGNMNMLNTN